DLPDLPAQVIQGPSVDLHLLLKPLPVLFAHPSSCRFVTAAHGHLPRIVPAVQPPAVRASCAGTSPALYAPLPSALSTRRSRARSTPPAAPPSTVAPPPSRRPRCPERSRTGRGRCRRGWGRRSRRILRGRRIAQHEAKKIRSDCLATVSPMSEPAR